MMKGAPHPLLQYWLFVLNTVFPEYNTSFQICPYFREVAYFTCALWFSPAAIALIFVYSQKSFLSLFNRFDLLWNGIEIRAKQMLDKILVVELQPNPLTTFMLLCFYEGSGKVINIFLWTNSTVPTNVSVRN